jgi:hypothetical protein
MKTWVIAISYEDIDGSGKLFMTHMAANDKESAIDLAFGAFNGGISWSHGIGAIDAIEIEKVID